ncbi:hypothetical protein [Okeania sp. SIO2C2]|uniref:hypothetical protein n=1 Tax=Okeania sp. SIO2C2 TaxID=2607787 RepID=UPI00257E0DFC|nr:hypothetical protein [Okeania sp. SIO2C2]
MNYYPEDILNYFGYQLIDENLERGFKQLAVELIALDKGIGIEAEQNLLYGAVSIGKILQFALLKRQEKQVKQDLSLYRVPNDLEDLITISVAIITGVKEENEE